MPMSLLTSLARPLSLTVLFCAALTITAHYLPRLASARYIANPLTTLLIIAIALQPRPFPMEVAGKAILVGLLFSLAGDILLMFADRFFAYGLLAFLLAHLSYAVAFQAGVNAPVFFWVLAAMLLIGLVGLRYLWPGLPQPLRPGVVIYAAALLLMAALALGLAARSSLPWIPIQSLTLEWERIASWRAAAGAVLFVASDAMLGIDRFRRPFRLSDALVLASYFSAQYLIAQSILPPVW